MTSVPALRIGCAGWTIRAEAKSEFGDGASHLARYASRFSAVEINSSFYRPHRPATYARWAESTPATFRFSVKIPRTITHELRLQAADEELQIFLPGPQALGEKLGVLLVQLPPSAAFQSDVAARFFEQLREQTVVPVVCEPRHRSWFEPEADQLLKTFGIARVAADPACVAAAAEPAGDPALVYYRLHGSPKTYYSAYDDARLQSLAAALRRHADAGRACWCIFDNTAAGAATYDALRLQEFVVWRAGSTRPAAGSCETSRPERALLGSSLGRERLPRAASFL